MYPVITRRNKLAQRVANVSSIYIFVVRIINISVLRQHRLQNIQGL